VTYLGIALAAGLAPAVARESVPARRRRQVARAVCGLALGEAVLAAVVFARAGDIVRLFGHGFASSAEILRLLTPYVFVAAFAPLASLLVTYLGSIRDRVVIGLTALGANVVLDLTLIPRYGLTGAAIAADLAALYYVCSHCWVVARTLELRSSMLVAVVAQAAMLGLLLAAGLACARRAADAGSASWGAASLLLVGAAAMFAVRLASPGNAERLSFSRAAE
jgi:O-antigen/teichoic acid export membrane protein